MLPTLVLWWNHNTYELYEWHVASLWCTNLKVLQNVDYGLTSTHHSNVSISKSFNVLILVQLHYIFLILDSQSLLVHHFDVDFSLATFWYCLLIIAFDIFPLNETFLISLQLAKVVVFRGSTNFIIHMRLYSIF